MHKTLFAAFVIAMAGAGSLSAQSQEKAQKPVEKELKVQVRKEPTFPVDLDELQWRLEGLKEFALDDKINAKIADAAEKSARMAEESLRIAGEIDAKFQAGTTGRGRGPGPVLIRGGNESMLYQNATRAIDNGHWDEAIAMFQRVIALNGSRADGATYWTAWAQNKQGNGAAALTTLSKLQETYPNSKWIPEARALAVELRQAAGQPVRPENVPDDELKLMALNSLMHADETRAIPMIDKILRGTGSPRLKERALFVLAQNGTPQARQIVIDIAKGGGNPDLQAKAVTYLGALGGAETRQALPDIYKASNSEDVKRSIIRAFMTNGDRARLLDLAKTESSPTLRAEAVQQLGAMGAQEELSELYQSEKTADVKKRIIQSMFTGHNEPKLIQLLRAETDEDLKRSIVQNLGMMATPTSADALTTVYTADKNDAVRRAVVDALGQQRNSKALIDLAKKETDPAMKKRIVERLSNMKSTEATDYFLELLSKP